MLGNIHGRHLATSLWFYSQMSALDHTLLLLCQLFPQPLIYMLSIFHLKRETIMTIQFVMQDKHELCAMILCDFRSSFREGANAYITVKFKNLLITSIYLDIWVTIHNKHATCWIKFFILPICLWNGSLANDTTYDWCWKNITLLWQHAWNLLQHKALYINTGTTSKLSPQYGKILHTCNVHCVTGLSWAYNKLRYSSQDNMLMVPI